MKKSTMAAVLCLLLGPSMAEAQVGTAFTYQGRLVDGAVPANGTYDLQFTLFDAVTAGAQVGATVTKPGVTVSAGLFTTSLDFGATAFAGTKRWLEIGVKLPAAGAYTLLTPRQELTPSPNAVFSATTGDPAVQRRTVAPTCPAGQYVRSLAADGTPTCVADATGTGTVTGVTASAPLASSGGAAPDISLTGSIPVLNGGTGSTTATGARTNLGAAASGANADITSLTGLTTPLAVTRGGTGATTAPAGRAALGAAASGANSDITALSGLSTALSVGQGGTGATSAAGGRAALGAAAAGANGDITSLSALATPLSIAQGGTGSATQPFVDLTTNQNVAGIKTFSGANAFTTTQTVSTGNAAAKGVVVKGAASQTANLLELQDSAGTVLSSIGPTGVFNGNITGSAASAATATTVAGLTCATGQVAKWSGAVWACGTDLSGTGTVTGVTASGPLSSSGGVAPNLSLTGTVPVANGGTGSATQNFVDLSTAQSVGGNKTLTGNLALVASTGTTGNVMKGGNRFIHNFGTSSTFVGENAGNFTMTGIYNTAAGVNALQSDTSGSSNTAIGVNALVANTSGAQNTAVGIASLFQNTTGSDNIAIGVDAGKNLTAGSSNIDIGNPGVAGESNTIRIGTPGTHTATFIAGNTTTFSGNIVWTGTATGSIGGNAATATTVGLSCSEGQVYKWVGGAWTCGADLTGAGGGTVTSVTSGTGLVTSPIGGITVAGSVSIDTAVVPRMASANTFTTTQTVSTGSAAGKGFIVKGAASQTANLLEFQDSTGAVLSSFGPTGNLTLPTPSTSTTGTVMKGTSRFLHNFGTANTFVGLNAGNFTTSGGGSNTAVGISALLNLATGFNNTASGAIALTANTDGNANTATGAIALGTNTTGSQNTATGENALGFNSSGSDNTAIGRRALHLNTTGFQNVAAGSGALQANSTGNGNIAIGFNAGSATTGSNNIDIGNTGAAAEAGTIRIGTPGTHTATFIAGNTTTFAGNIAWTGTATGNINGSAGSVAWTNVASKPAGFADNVDDTGVISVATGAGLSGGPILGSGTVDLRLNAGGGLSKTLGAGTNELGIAPGGVLAAMIGNGAVGSAQLASGAVGLTKINTAEVQARLSASCPAGQHLRGVNANGAVACEPFNTLPLAITTIDDPIGLYGNEAGKETSLAIGLDGFPVISYTAPSGQGVRVAKCANASCTGTTTISTITGTTGANAVTWIAIGVDGFPVVSYQDVPTESLRVAKCVNAACTGSSTLTTVEDGANAVGQSHSIAIGADGFPVISYLDATAGALKVAKCASADCTGAITITVVDPGPGGADNAIAIGADGLPVISYLAGTGPRVAKCVNPACTGASTITGVDVVTVGGGFGYGTSIAIGADGRPIISYMETGGASWWLKVAKCANAACTGASTITNFGSPGFRSSLAMGPEGFPVISYLQGGVGGWGLRVRKCVDAACTGPSIVTTLDIATPNDSSWRGLGSSMAIGADGLPVISYAVSAVNTSGPGSLKVAHCNQPSCDGSIAWTGTAAGNAASATSFSGNLVGEITGTQGATVVSGAVPASTANAIVRRDAFGNFAAGIISADLAGTAAYASSLAGNPANCAGGMAAGIDELGAAEGCVSVATANAVNAIVQRDASGNFSAGTISASLNGNATTATTAAGVSGIVPVANGGTGAATPSAALANLGAAARGVNNDITSLGSTSPLSSIYVSNPSSLAGTRAISSTVSGISTMAVLGETTSASGGVGVYGLATAATGPGLGVRGFSQSSSGTGVRGTANAATGTTYGVYGEANSAAGYGLYTPDRAHIGGALSVQGSTTLNGLSGNLAMLNSTGTTGNITKGGVSFIHDSGTENTFIGASAGTLSLTGTGNTGAGMWTLSGVTRGNYNTAAGGAALRYNTTAGQNTAVGISALQTQSFSNTDTAWNSDNTAVGFHALLSNQPTASTNGIQNTAIGSTALRNNSTGAYNTAGGYSALAGNTTGAFNTAIGVGADVTSGGLNNATAIGYGAKATASDMVRIGNGAVTVIQGQVAFTASSDRNKKENLRDVNAQEILAKLRGMSVTSWNYIGHDPKEFRHYGPMAQDFFAAFGRDEVGAIGTETTINSGDIAGILMIGLKGLDAQVQKGLRTIDAQAAEIAALKQQTARIADLEVSRQALTAELASLKAQVGRIVELEAQTARVVAVLQGLAVQSASSVSAPAAKGAEEPRK